MTAYGLSDRGIVRANNQDTFRIVSSSESGHLIAVLCDGMGGVHGGEIASQTAAEAFISYVQEKLSVWNAPELAVIGREAASYANLKVYDRAQRNENLLGMGTTLVAAILRGDETVMINIGDSRGYWFSDGKIQQVTRDHSHVQDLMDQGIITKGEARSHPHRNLITRAVGVKDRIRSDIFRLDLHTSDRLLLCSDGLSNLVTEEELADVLASEEDLKTCCDRLLAMALDRGAPDNVTVVILSC